MTAFCKPVENVYCQAWMWVDDEDERLGERPAPGEESMTAAWDAVDDLLRRAGTGARWT